jgi:hypothetical protein
MERSRFTKAKTRLFGFALVLLATCFGRAGTITIVNLSATGTDAATGINSTNAYLCCIDFGNYPTPPATINGVSFIHPDLGNQIVNTTNGVDASHSGTYSITTGGSAACRIARTYSTTQGGVTNQADGNTRLLLTDFIYVGSAAPTNSWMNQIYGGLVSGRQYALRIYYRQWAAGPRTINITFNGEGTNQAYVGNPLNEDVGGSHYLQYAFTASSTNVFVGMTNLVANESPLIYAVTLEDRSPPSAPIIVTQPAGGTNAVGTTFDFSVSASGFPPIFYQWYKDGSSIAGATNDSLAFGYLRSSDAGSYLAVVSNLSGATASSAASLVIAGPLPTTPDFSPTDTALAAAANQALAIASAADSNTATINWSAHWIGPAASYTNLWLCYRKGFSLPAQPASAIGRIAADSKYWLWVNGEIAVREGELRRDPNPVDTWYDEVDLAPFLQPGSNTIAILQWHFGKTGFSHTNSGSAGLIFEMNADGTVVKSDTSWRMITNTAFQLATTVPQPNFRISESSLRYDARLDLGAWTNQNFDDSGWSSPLDLGAAGVSPWGKLWLRPLPFWQELPLQDFASTNATGSNPAVWTCYLPYNEQFTPWLDVTSSTAGLIISIVPDTVTNTASPGHEYVTRAGRQSFEFPAWISGHYVQFSVPAGVTVYGLKYRPHLANTQRLGSFTSDDPFFTTLWNKAANTLGVNMMDTWGETRERANWIGDTSLILGQVPYAYDPMAELISRRSLLNLIRWQRPDNTMFAPAPANNKELPVQVLAAIGDYGVMRYYRDTGDLALLQQCYPAIKTYLLSVWQTNSLSLVVHRVGQWDWEDWGDNIDPPLLDNAWYLLALDAAAQMAPLVGQPLDAASFLSRAQGIRNQFNASFWTSSGYRSSTYTGDTDERGNAMAVLAGLTTPAQSSTLRTVLINEQHCSPYMEKYVLEALFALGYPDDALARMRSRYAAMVAASATTLWELFPATGGFNHGWSGGPLTLLDEDVAGLTPTSPAFETFDVRPALGTTLSRADASVPSPFGLISISAARDISNYRLSVRVPPGCSGRSFQPASGGLLSGAALSIDGGAMAVMDDIANPSELNVVAGAAALITNVSSAGALAKTGAGNLYIGSSSSLSVGSFEVVTGQTIVSVGGQLMAASAGAADGHITVQSGGLLDNEGGSITCNSLNVIGAFEESAGSTLTVAGGVTNQGTFRLIGNAQLTTGGTFANNGTLDIMTWQGTLPSGLVNTGTILDRSAIKIESCLIDRQNFDLTIMGYAGHDYQLQYSAGLQSPAWTNLGAIQAGNQAPIVFVHTNALANIHGFYRVAVDPLGN